MIFYVGSYTRLGGPGIAVCSLEQGRLRMLDRVDLANPTYLIAAADERVYAVSSDPVRSAMGGSYASFVRQESRLVRLAQYDTGATGPCHLCLSPDGRFLYVANYFDGALTVFPLDPAGERIQLIRHTGHSVHPVRQASPHVHQVSFLPGTTVLAAVDLGLDALVFYDQDPASGLLSEASRLSLPAGLGPRHLTYGPAGTIWLAHELGNRISVLSQADHRVWTVTQTLSTLPDNWQGKSTAAAIRTNGRFVFVSNRGHDSLAVFAADAAGQLTCTGIFPSQGNLPRDFALLPDGNVLVAHQGGDVTVLHWDEACLKLRSGDCSLPLPGAVCICLPPHVKE